METTTSVGMILGELRIVSFDFAPLGWAFCNGQILSINQNQALFSLLGVTYGGDGRTTFALPDLRGRAPIHLVDGYVSTLGKKLGSETATVTLDQMAGHVHPVYGIYGLANSDVAAGNTWAASTDAQHPLYTTKEANVDMSGYCITSAGGNGQGKSDPHENRQPYIAMNYVIALSGDFPTRA